MIASLKGILKYKSLQNVIIDVGGVGFSVNIPFSTYQALPELKHEVSLLIYTHITDGAISLYGFFGEGEKDTFEQLISISKIGPKSALAVLSGLSISDLKSAIIQKDINKLSSIQGVGKKMAERIILELTDKKDFIMNLKDFTVDVDMKMDEVLEDASAALEKLGYSEKQIKSTIWKVLDKGTSDNNAESIIRESLKLLQKIF